MAITTSSMLDVDQLAEYLNVPVRMVRRLVHQRDIPFHKIGKYVRFDPAAIDKWVQENRIDPNPGGRSDARR